MATAVSFLANSLDDHVSNLPFSPDFFLSRVDFRVDLRSSIICCVELCQHGLVTCLLDGYTLPMLFVKSNDLVNGFLRGISSPLAFANRFWIPPSFRNEIHNVKHIGSRTATRAKPRIYGSWREFGLQSDVLI